MSMFDIPDGHILTCRSSITLNIEREDNWKTTALYCFYPMKIRAFVQKVIMSEYQLAWFSCGVKSVRYKLLLVRKNLLHDKTAFQTKGPFENVCFKHLDYTIFIIETKISILKLVRQNNACRFAKILVGLWLL